MIRDIQPAEPAGAGLADHLATYGGFIHLVRWVALHVLIDVAGILALIERHIPLGLLLLVCGAALLVWAVATTRAAAKTARGGVPSAG